MNQQTEHTLKAILVAIPAFRGSCPYSFEEMYRTAYDAALADAEKTSALVEDALRGTWLSERVAFAAGVLMYPSRKLRAIGDALDRAAERALEFEGKLVLVKAASASGTMIPDIWQRVLQALCESAE